LMWFSRPHFRPNFCKHMLQWKGFCFSCTFLTWLFRLIFWGCWNWPFFAGK
jgi:hypothetical protein